MSPAFGVAKEGGFGICERRQALLQTQYWTRTMVCSVFQEEAVQRVQDQEALAARQLQACNGRLATLTGAPQPPPQPPTSAAASAPRPSHGAGMEAAPSATAAPPPLPAAAAPPLPAMSGPGEKTCLVRTPPIVCWSVRLRAACFAGGHGLPCVGLCCVGQLLCCRWQSPIPTCPFALLLVRLQDQNGWITRRGFNSKCVLATTLRRVVFQPSCATSNHAQSSGRLHICFFASHCTTRISRGDTMPPPHTTSDVATL